VDIVGAASSLKLDGLEISDKGLPVLARAQGARVALAPDLAWEGY
jgi:hypothetical protein